VVGSPQLAKPRHPSQFWIRIPANMQPVEFRNGLLAQIITCRRVFGILLEIRCGLKVNARHLGFRLC